MRAQSFSYFLKLQCYKSFLRTLSAFLCLLILFSFPSSVFCQEQDALHISGTSSFYSSYPQEVEIPVCGMVEPGLAPVFLCAVNDLVMNAGEKIMFSVFKKGYDPQLFSVQVEGMPDGAVFENGTFSWTPAEAQVGSYCVSFLLTSGVYSAEKIEVPIDILPTVMCDEYESGSDFFDEQDAGAGGGDVDIREQAILPSGEQRMASAHVSDASAMAVMYATPEGTRALQNNNERATRTMPTPSTVPYRTGTMFSGWQTTSSSTFSDTSRGRATVSAVQGAMQSALQRTIPETHTTPVESTEVAPPPAKPMLSDPGVATFNGVAMIEWSDTGAYTYELQQALDASFVSSVQTVYVDDPVYELAASMHPSSGHYYYRVRSWNGPVGGGGESSEYSNVVMLTVDYERAVDVLASSTRGIFTQVAGGPSAYREVDDGSLAYSNPVIRFDYDVSNQDFAGMFFVLDPTQQDISAMKTVNMRVRGDAAVGFPMRMIIELKYGGSVQGVSFVTAIDTTYRDFVFPLYAESGLIEEVTIFVEDDIDGDRMGAILIDEFFLSAQEYVPDVMPDVEVNAGPGVTDAELIEKVEADTALYFYNEVVGAGHVKDTLDTDYSSIAATGFGLGVLAILAERYDATSPYWNVVTVEMAQQRVRAILADLLRIQGAQAVSPNHYGVNGFFYHFIDAEGQRVDECEVSVVDTALLIAGALLAGEYFGGDIKEMADALYAAIDWTFFIDESTYQFYMGWKPEASRGFYIPKGDGYLSSALFNTPTDEILLVTLLALGNHLENDVVRKSYYAYPRVAKSYTARTGYSEGEQYTVVHSYFGSLFTYLYAHCFFNFEAFGEDKTYFAEDAPYPVSVDWWDNSVQAFRAARQFCVDEREYYPFSYTENSWGVSAVQRPDGRYEGRYGAVPFDNGPGHDGVIAAGCALSGMPFFKESENEILADNESFQVLRYWYDNYYAQLFGPYGVYDSYDNEANFSKTYLGIDQGPIVFMIENYRTQFFWNLLEQNEKIANAVDLVFTESFDWLDVELIPIDANQTVSETTLDFGFSDGSETIVSALNYLAVSANFAHPTGELVIYTDNGSQYTGAGSAGGLVGTSDTSQKAPLYWVVFDEVQDAGYSFQTNGHYGVLQDCSDADYALSEKLAERSLVDGYGDLGMYPAPDRETFSSMVYVYAACDYAGLDPQEYKTETLTIEIFHQ